jgi:heme-degrading monooxygenase HmoA
MYGTIAKMRVKAGKEAEFEQTMTGARETPGFVFAHVYRMDTDPQELMLVVAFDSKDSYRKNAESPEQHQEYLAYRELLDAEPEWHDGEIVFSEAQAGSAAASS